MSSPFDQTGGDYVATVDRSLRGTGATQAWAARVKAAYLFDILDAGKRPSRDLDLLDLGCGVGTYLKLLGGRFRTLTGADSSLSSLEAARGAHGAIRLAAADASALPFDAASFDVVILITALHHIPPARWDVAIQEAARVLRPRGRLVIFEHNPRNPLTRRAVDACPLDADAVLLPAGQVEALLDKAGLVRVTSRYILSIPAASRILRRIDGAFSWLRLGAQYYVVGIKPDSGPALSVT